MSHETNIIISMWLYSMYKHNIELNSSLDVHTFKLITSSITFECMENKWNAYSFPLEYTACSSSILWPEGPENGNWSQWSVLGDGHYNVVFKKQFQYNVDIQARIQAYAYVSARIKCMKRICKNLKQTKEVRPSYNRS